MAFQLDISTPEAFKSEVLSTPGVLQVVEAYQEAFGPCKAIQSIFRRLCYDFSDRPLKFYTANTDKVADKSISQYKGKCQPVFLLYKDGKLIEVVQGVQAPALIRLITTLSEVKQVV